MDEYKNKLSKKDTLLNEATVQLETKEKELEEKSRAANLSKVRVEELKEIIERKNQDIDNHKKLLEDKNEQLDQLKNLQPRIRDLELEKADQKTAYEKEINSLKADIQKVEEDREKTNQEIVHLNEIIEDKDIQFENALRYKDLFLAMLNKPKPGLTSFQSQIFELLPDAKTASELYDYLIELGFTELEKENFAKTLKALEKRGYYQRAREGDRIIWVKIKE
jgi:chromosome segregation ATPase